MSHHVNQSGSTTSNVSEIEQYPGLDALTDDVRSLLDATEVEDFQSGLDWYRLLAGTTCAADEQVRLMVLRRGGRASAALPLVMRARSRAPELSSLTNYYSSRFVAPIHADTPIDDLARLIAALRQLRPRPASLTLAPMDRDDRRYALLHEALKSAGLVAFEYFCFGNWYLPAGPYRGAADDYLASRPGEVRSTLRRMARRFDAAQGQIEIVTAASDAERAVAAFNAVYALSWKRPEPHPAFMPGLVQLCARRGWMRMGIAWLDGQPIAAQLWVVCGGRASIFKLAYDERHARYSPGTLLTAALMRRVMDVDRVEEVDYMTGDDGYKRTWMSQRRERWGLVAYDPRVATGAWLAAKEAAGRLAKASLARLGRRGLRAAPTAGEAAASSTANLSLRATP